MSVILAEKLPANELSYFDWLAPRRFRRGYRLWAFVGVLTSCLCLAFFYFSGEVHYLSTFLPLSLGTLAVPIAVRFGHRLVCNWEVTAARFVVVDADAFHQWFEKRVFVYLRALDVPAFGLLYLIAAIFAFRSGGAFSNLSNGGILFSGTLLAISAFCCGVGVATLCRLAHLIWSLGAFPVKVGAGNFGVMSTGPLLVRCYLLGGVVWCLYTSSAAWNLSAGWIPMLALAAPAVLIITGSFVISQIPLHFRMVEYKRNRTYEIEEMLSEVAPQSPDDLTEDRLKQIQFLHEELDKTARLPEWPFGWRSLAAAFLTSVGSAGPTILGFVVRHYIPGLASLVS